MDVGVRTLLVDNYDSFTFNLFQLLAEVNGREPLVVRNDELAWDDVDEDAFDNIVISPGPGRPDRRRDVGVSADAISRSRLPLLGVCLGHQALCLLHGATVGPAPEGMHGRLSLIHHDGSGVFAGLPSPFRAVRYHSLAATAIPGALRVTATAGDGVVMGVAHRTRPQWGVQFHPESISTQHGRRLLDNFRRLSADRRIVRAGARRPRAGDAPRPVPSQPTVVHSRRLPQTVDAETLYLNLFSGARASFWLDSSAASAEARFSFLGDDSGPRAEYLTYRVRDGVLRRRTTTATTTVPGPFLARLDHLLAQRRVADAGLPFAFNLGYVGWIGYELKRECGADAAHSAATPDAALLFADRMVVVDHERAELWLLCLAEGDDAARAEGWLEETTERIAALPPPAHLPEVRGRGRVAAAHDGDRHPVPFTLRHPASAYRELVQACQREIRAGETYEVCLTNSLVVHAEADLLRAHLASRRRNPAPYAAYLSFPDAQVVSASPERFLTLDRDRTVETRPIKGTRRRSPDPAEDAALAAALAGSEKDRAENLMIVDLARNDLGRVCDVGTVTVPRLFDVESFATVHHLVSTVRGRLRRPLTAVDAVRSAFPGGSMTGAPKLRTMELLDRLEGTARGVYSGAIGWFALNGSCDLSMAIRTIVGSAGRVEMGVGGAVVALSDPDSEVAEMLLKAEGGLDALAFAVTPPRCRRLPSSCR